MNNRIASLAADCCVVRLTNKDGSEVLRILEGGELSTSVTPVLTPPEQSASLAGTFARKSGTVTLATWRHRWYLLVFPHGRASVYEFTKNKLFLNSTFDCPVNTSAAVLLDDDMEDCALAVFGTDEGPRSSKVHVARLTFSSESLSVKPLKTWRCAGGVSSLAPLSNRLILVGFTSCEGVGIFDPFAFEDPTSPSLGIRQRPIPVHKPLTSFSPEQHLRPPISAEKTEFIQTRIPGEGVPVWVSVRADKVLTLTRCGTLRCYDEDELDSPEHTLFLGFDVVGIRNMPTNDGIVVCGWRGETALIDLETGQIAKFIRSRDNVRVDDFAITVSGDSRVLLMQTDADDGGAIRVFDFGRAALLGACKRVIVVDMTDHFAENLLEDDELEFAGTNELLDQEEVEVVSPSINTGLMKSMMKEAYELMIEETE